MIHATNLLVLLAFWFFALSMVPGKLSKVRHKQLTGVKLWATGHPGERRSRRHAALRRPLAWAVVTVIVIKRQARNGSAPQPRR